MKALIVKAGAVLVAMTIAPVAVQAQQAAVVPATMKAAPAGAASQPAQVQKVNLGPGNGLPQGAPPGPLPAAVAAPAAALATSTQSNALVVSADAVDGVRGLTRCAADLGLGVALAGRIAEVRVKEGQRVKTGDVLMRLEQEAERLDVERRQVQWQGQAELKNALARRETAEGQAQAARRIYHETRGISKDELDNRELAYTQAAAEVEKLQMTKEMERLDYMTARENLARRTIRAPGPGIVTKLIKSAGESVQAHEPALKLCDLSSIQVVVNVPSQSSESLKAGGSVKLKVGQIAQAMQGKVTFVSPVIDGASGLREVKVELLRPGAEVRPGLPVSLDLSH